MKSSPRVVRNICVTAVSAAFASTLPGAVLARPVIEEQQVQAGATPQKEGADTQSPTISQVVVTSRKFTERLVDVPIAIAVFSNEDLLRRGANSISDVLQSVPGVSTYNAGSGVNKISIRGISTSLGANENGYYLDDLPFTGVTVPISPDVRAWDLERIEVLRGPQGTLFGEGSMGGTIRTLTNNARLNQFSFAGQAGISHTEGGGDNRSVKAMINVPVITDMLAIRIAMTNEDYKGWIDDPSTNRNDINTAHPKTVRVRTLFKPTDALTINASYWDYKNNLPYGANETDQGTASRGTALGTVPTYTVKGISGTYDFDDVSVFYGYANNRYRLSQSGAFAGGTLDANIGIDVETHELRLSSNAQKPWRWTAGLYRRTANRLDGVTATAIGLDQISGTDSTASAIFGDITYTFPDFPLEASIGARHFRDRIAAQNVNLGIPEPQTNDKFSSNNPRVSLAYRPNENQQIYASAAKGFRSGQNQITGISELAAQYGVTLPSSIKSDSIWSYELGTKLSALQRRLNMEFAVYYSDWKDFAVRIPIGASGFNGLTTSDGTKTKGLDASFAYAFTKSFTGTLTAGFIDAKYKGSVAGTDIKSGTRVDDVPRYNVSASADYSFPVVPGWDGTARASVQRVGAHPSAQGAIQAAGDQVSSVDARLSLNNGPWTVALFGDNLTNNHAATGYRTINYLTATETESIAPRLRPRTVGLELRYAFGK